MPAVSKKQQKFMQAVAKSPKFAKKVGVKQSIGREFTKEKDMKKAVKKMNMGGRAMNDRDGSVAMDPKMQMAMAAQQKRAAMGGMKKGGKVKKTTPLDSSIKPGGTRFFDSDEVRAAKRKADKKNKKRIDKQRKELGYKAGGKVKKMRMGGPTARTKSIMNEKDEIRRVDREIREKEGYKKGGKVKKMNMGGMADKEGRALVKKTADARGRAMKTGGMLARTGGSSAPMKAKGKKMMGGGKVKAYKKGGTVSSASKRADGIAQQGHTRGRIV